jgi:hypothetical protein
VLPVKYISAEHIVRGVGSWGFGTKGAEQRSTVTLCAPFFPHHKLQLSFVYLPRNLNEFMFGTFLVRISTNAKLTWSSQGKEPAKWTRETIYTIGNWDATGTLALTDSLDCAAHVLSDCLQCSVARNILTSIPGLADCHLVLFSLPLFSYS